MSGTPLRDRFGGLWKRLGAADEGEPVFGRLLAAYQESHRHYHGLNHLRDCLAQLDTVPIGTAPVESAPDENAPVAAAGRDLAEAALWFHDAVYTPGAPDNEARSAEWAHQALDRAGVPEARIREVARLIRLTDHARPAQDPAAALVCDIDLSILGRPPAEYAEYERRIRAEYATVAEPLYRAGRMAILARFLAREPLYRTGHFRELYEAAARRNLQRSLATLASVGRPE